MGSKKQTAHEIIHGNDCHHHVLLAPVQLARGRRCGASLLAPPGGLQHWLQACMVTDWVTGLFTVLVTASVNPLAWNTVTVVTVVTVTPLKSSLVSINQIAIIVIG